MKEKFCKIDTSLQEFGTKVERGSRGRGRGGGRVGA